jgi:hypothetical protein
MVGLETYTGFAILLLLPLLLWSRYRRTRAREVPLSIFPIIADIDAEPPSPRRRLRRLNAVVRYILFSIALVCLSLAVNGIHLVREEERTGEWAMVVDNTHAINSRIGDKTVKDIMVDSMESVISIIPDGDTVTMITTSPEPVIEPRLTPGRSVDYLKNISAAKEYYSPETLFDYFQELFRDRKLKGAWLISPRANQFRDIPDSLPEPTLRIPPDDQFLTGNWGITSLDISPGGGGKYNLQITVDGLGESPEELRVTDSRGSNETLENVPGESGPSELTLRTDLYPGSTILALPGGDTLPDDDSVVINIPGGEGPLSVRLPGKPDTWFREALASHDGFELVQENHPADATVYLRDVPADVPDTPLLLIFPTGSPPGFEFRRIITAPPSASFSPGHPLTRDVSFSNFRPLKLVDMGVPGPAVVLARAGGLPLVTAGSMGDHRFVIWHFDPADSGIYLDPGFPVMLRESVRWLAGINLYATGLLSKRLTLEAASVTVPDLSKIAEDLPADTIRSDIGRPFIALALVIFFLLLMDRALAREAQ